MLDPIAAFDRKNQSLDNESIFFSTLDKDDYYLYIEDRNKKAFYENLLKKLYPNLQIRVYDNFSGKTNVINEHFRIKSDTLTKNKEKHIFLLDRDYELIFEHKNYRSLANHNFYELKNNPSFRILSKTNIETYFLDINKLILTFSTITGASEDCIRKLLLENTDTDTTLANFFNFSLFYMLSQGFEGTFPKSLDHLCFDSYSTTDLFKKHIIKLKKHIEDNKQDFLKENTHINFTNFCTILKSVHKNYSNVQKYIDGKIFLQALIKILQNNGLNNIKTDSVIRVMTLLIDDKIAFELRNDLCL